MLKMEQLSENAIKVMSENSETTNPVLVQIQSIETTPLTYKSNSKLLEAHVSDGFTFRTVILVNPNPNIVQSKAHPIIRVKNWQSKGTLILVKECEIVHLDFKDQIGNPMPYDEYEKNNYQNPRGSNQIMHNQTKFKISVQGNNNKQAKLVIKTDKKLIQQQQQAIQKIQEEPNQSQLFSIKDLYPGIQAFKIKAKIVAKSNITNFKSGKGHFFTIELIDVGSTHAQGIFYNESCDKFYSILNVGSVYTLEGKVHHYDYSSKFWHLKQPKSYQITFNENSHIQEQDEMLFIPQQIKSTDQFQQNDRIDVLVVVYDFGGLFSEKVKWNDENVSRRTYQVYDQTKMIKVTFWGQHAELQRFNPKQIIAISQLKVKSYLGKDELSGTEATKVETKVEELQKIQGYDQLYKDYIFGNI